MIYIFLAIFFALCLVIVFRLYKTYKVDAFQAIVVNYIVCVITGSIFLGEFPFEAKWLEAEWMPFACGLGSVFVIAFYAAAMSVQYFGMAVTAVIQRMSLAISVPFAILLLGESASITKIIGVLIALFSVILINIPAKAERAVIEEKSRIINYKLFIFPAGAFLSSGMVECGLQWVQDQILVSGSSEAEVFSIYLFGVAAFSGIILGMILLLRGKIKLAWRNLWGGIALGIPNYFSILFLIKAFDYWDKSAILPINNIAVVLLAVLFGFLIFKEKLSILNMFGVALAVLSILLIAF